MSTQRNEVAVTASDGILVCSGCHMPLRRGTTARLPLVHLEPWCTAMDSGEARPITVTAKLVHPDEATDEGGGDDSQ